MSFVYRNYSSKPSSCATNFHQQLSLSLSPEGGQQLCGSINNNNNGNQVAAAAVVVKTTDSDEKSPTDFCWMKPGEEKYSNSFIRKHCSSVNSRNFVRSTSSEAAATVNACGRIGETFMDDDCNQLIIVGLHTSPIPSRPASGIEHTVRDFSC
jgi:hypothetical protein